MNNAHNNKYLSTINVKIALLTHFHQQINFLVSANRDIGEVLLMIANSAFHLRFLKMDFVKPVQQIQLLLIINAYAIMQILNGIKRLESVNPSQKTHFI